MGAFRWPHFWKFILAHLSAFKFSIVNSNFVHWIIWDSLIVEYIFNEDYESMMETNYTMTYIHLFYI